jgi:hypothetical protein
MTMTGRRLKTSEIKTGDVVCEHGMRVRIDQTRNCGDDRGHGPVYAHLGTVLNPKEVRQAGIVPPSFCGTRSA